MMADLNDKQQRFVDEYLIDLNATQAAIRAGYSERTAYSIGHELLKKPEIEVALAEAMKARGERVRIEADQVLRELARVGMSDIRSLFRENGQLKEVGELDSDTAAAVASVEVQVAADGQCRTHKVRLWDKNSALEKLGKHFAMFTDRHINETVMRSASEMSDDELMSIIEKGGSSVDS